MLEFKVLSGAELATAENATFSCVESNKSVLPVGAEVIMDGTYEIRQQDGEEANHITFPCKINGVPQTLWLSTLIRSLDCTDGKTVLPKGIGEQVRAAVLGKVMTCKQAAEKALACFPQKTTGRGATKTTTYEPVVVSKTNYQVLSFKTGKPVMRALIEFNAK